MGRKSNGNGDLAARLLQIAEEAGEDADWRELALSLRDNRGKGIVERMEAFLHHRASDALRARFRWCKKWIVRTISHPSVDVLE